MRSPPSALRVVLWILVVYILARAAARGDLGRTALWMTIAAALGYLAQAGLRAAGVRETDDERAGVEVATNLAEL